MAGVHGSGDTQSSCFLPGTCTRDPSPLLPLPTFLAGNLIWGRGSPSWPSGRALLPSLSPSPPELNFGAITLNSMDATSERDFVGES